MSLCVPKLSFFDWRVEDRRQKLAIAKRVGECNPLRPAEVEAECCSSSPTAGEYGRHLKIQIRRASMGISRVNREQFMMRDKAVNRIHGSVGY